MWQYCAFCIHSVLSRTLKNVKLLRRPRHKTLDVTKRSFYDKKNLCSWRVVPNTQIAANRQTGSRFAAKWCWDTGGLRNHLLRHGNAYRNSICKRLRKYSASVCGRGLKMSNRVESSAFATLYSL